MRTVTWKDSKRTPMIFRKASNIISRSFLFSGWTKRGIFSERPRIFSTLPVGTLIRSPMMRLRCPKNGQFSTIKKKISNNSDENSETMNSRKNIFQRKTNEMIFLYFILTVNKLLFKNIGQSGVFIRMFEKFLNIIIDKKKKFPIENLIHWDTEV